MKTYKKTINTPRLVIEHDDTSESPRIENDNLGYFITCEKRRNSPDNEEDLISLIQSAGDESNNQDEHIKNITERMGDTYGKVLVIYPITRYEHSGISYSLGTTKGFDYSNNGFYIVTDKTASRAGLRAKKNIPTTQEKKIWEDIINQELEAYNHYVNGEIYRFTLYNDKGEQVDACGGFYDLEAIQQNLPKEWKDEKMSEYFNQ